MTGERLREALRHTALRSIVERRLDGGLHGERRTPFRGNDGLDERLRHFVGEQIRERVTEGLRDRIALAIGEGVDDAIRDRLGGAIRRALVEERGFERFDDTRLAEAIRYEFADSLRSRLNEAVKHRVAETLRYRLSEAIERGVTQAQH
jgi:hypothetical protein